MTSFLETDEISPLLIWQPAVDNPSSSHRKTELNQTHRSHGRGSKERSPGENALLSTMIRRLHNELLNDLIIYHGHLSCLTQHHSSPRSLPLANLEDSLSQRERTAQHLRQSGRPLNGHATRACFECYRYQYNDAP